MRARGWVILEEEPPFDQLQALHIKDQYGDDRAQVDQDMND